MQKLIKDGKVAVLVSRGFGAGWSTWGSRESCMDGDMAQAVLDGNFELAREVAAKHWPNDYEGGIEDCQVEWVDEGVQFELAEYDGSESLRIMGETNFLTA